MIYRPRSRTFQLSTMLSTILALLHCCFASPGSTETESTTWTNIPNTQFLISPEYTLAVRRPPSQIASFPPHFQLIVVFDGKLECTIRRIDDLEGYVAIDSAQKAVDFVRLLTDEKTSEADLGQWLGAEILADGKLSSTTGRIPKAVLQAIDWRASIAALDGKEAWLVHRFILLRESPFTEQQVAMVTERVGKSGTYIRVESRVVWKGELKECRWPMQL